MSEIRLGVNMGNWNALRSWVALGYDRITKLSATDGASSSPPTPELMKTLSARVE